MIENPFLPQELRDLYSVFALVQGSLADTPPADWKEAMREELRLVILTSNRQRRAKYERVALKLEDLAPEAVQDLLVAADAAIKLVG
jgi:hypothetical protein